MNKEKITVIAHLALRLWFGYTMMDNGRFIFDDSNIAYFSKWFGHQLHFPAPILMYYLAKGSEFFGGLFIFLGLFTRVSGGFVAFTMLVATLTANRNNIFDGDGIITISFFLFAVFFVITGPGKWSLNYLFFKDKLKGAFAFYNRPVSANTIDDGTI